MADKKKINTTKRNVTNKKEEKSKKKDWNSFFRSTSFLAIIFIGLIILIVCLGIGIYRKEQKKIEEFDAHITIPVLKKDSNFEFGVDSYLLAKEHNKEYIFKITNFRNDEKALEEIPFQIVIENDTKASISLTRGDLSEDLIKGQKKTIIDDIMPLSQEDEAIYYHLKITSSKSLKKDQFIQIQILS